MLAQDVALPSYYNGFKFSHQSLPSFFCQLIPFVATTQKSLNIPLVFSFLDSLSMELVVLIIIFLDVVENSFPLSRHIGKASGYLLCRVNPFQVPLSKLILWFLENCTTMVKANSLVFLEPLVKGPHTLLEWTNTPRCNSCGQSCFGHFGMNLKHLV